jgi:predicted secreted acid phosphatase
LLVRALASVDEQRSEMSVVEEIVVFDIDGTLADVSERIQHLKKKPKDWDAFFKGMAQDKAIRSMVRLCNILYSSGVRVILCSGRSEPHRKETVEWLTRQGVNYHELLLRRDGDRRSDVIVKREMLAGIDKSKVLFVVEDRSRVVKMWRSEGLVCLQCAPGEF